MKVVLAPDKFKGSLPASAICDAVARGVKRACPPAVIDLCPMADGGEGLVRAMVDATGGRIESRRVTGPLPEMTVDAEFGLLGDRKTAVVEMAAASGLALVPPEDRNPLYTTTFGTGQLLMAAAALGVEHIILGIGGSATTDAGIGCAQACGLPVILEDGQPVFATEPLCGRDMPQVVLIKNHRGSPIERVKITVACDVGNPLFGPTGAAVVYGPQKGATPPQVAWLDEQLRQLATRTGKLAEAQIPGAGAAGGLGFGMLAYFGATLKNGAQIVIEATGLARRLAGADLCITGEGRLDEGSLHGKAPMAVARLCKSMGIPCIALAGSVGLPIQSLHQEGITAAFPLDDGSRPLAETIRQSAQLLEKLAENCVREWIENTGRGTGSAASGQEP